MSTTAAASVFGISELVQAILIYLDFDDLLNAGKACQFFRNVSTSSPKLQTKHFLRAGPTASPSYT
jgi:hypothetical protein